MTDAVHYATHNQDYRAKPKHREKLQELLGRTSIILQIWIVSGRSTCLVLHWSAPPYSSPALLSPENKNDTPIDGPSYKAY